MTDKEYRQAEGISKSQLWHIRKSPAHFKYALENPEEPAPSLLFGQVVHKLLLEPDSFTLDFAIMPKIDRRTNAGKMEYAAFIEGLNGQTVIDQDMFDKAIAMVAALKENKLAASLLDKLNEREQPYFWKDAQYEDLLCKCKIDGLGRTANGELFILDYKTTTEASHEDFTKSAYKYGYDVQAAHYKKGVESVLGEEVKHFIFIVQEKNEPYLTNIFVADLDFMDSGYLRRMELLDVYTECLKTGKWYGYEGAEPSTYRLNVPAWAKSDGEVYE